MSRLNNIWFNYGADVFSWVVNNWMRQKSNKWHMLVVVKTFIMQDIARSHIGILKWKTPRTKVWIPQPRRKAGSSWSIPTPDWILFQPKKKGPHSGGPRSRYSKSQGRVRVKVRSKRSTRKNCQWGGDNFSFDNFMKSLN